MKRASEAFRSTLVKRCRPILCAAAVAAFAVCMSPKASAQTYTPSSVACLSGGNYQPPTYDPVDPTPSNIAQLDAESYNSTVYKVSCTWSGFPHIQIASPMTLHVGVNYGSNIGSGPNGSHCGGGSALVTSTSGIHWYTTCNSGQLTETAEVPANTWLDSLDVTGEVQTASTNPPGTDDNAVLNINTISIY